MTWCAKAKGAYAETSDEAYQNALEAYSLLSSRGWTLQAFCGMWGNVGHEGGYNPWRWQGDKVQPTSNSPWHNIGYGFTQFTPGGKYINDSRAKAITGYAPNFSNQTGNASDGYAQMVFVDAYADYYPTTKFPLSYGEYKVSTQPVATMVEIWMRNYERPGSYSTLPTRQKSGEYWFQKLSGVTPEPPTPPGPVPHTSTRMPLLFYLRRRDT